MPHPRQSTPAAPPATFAPGRARTLRTWLLAALLVAVWLCANAALDGQPTETDAARATAAAARDVERQGALLAGSAR